MNQVPAISPIPQPNYNAVKIDIINPQAGGIQQPVCTPVQQPMAPAQQPVAMPQPQAQVYEYPQSSIYSYPQAPQQTCPIPVPVATQPQPAQVNVNQAPSNNDVQQPAVDTAPVADAVQPQPVDVNAFLARLADPNFETQAAAMEDIANLIKTNPKQAADLLKEDVFKSLTNIIETPSDKLEGPTQEQTALRTKMMNGEKLTDAEAQIAQTITPMENAERNKCYALFTTAMLQKLYGDEVKNISGTTVPLTDLPAVIKVVDNLKDNPNPLVRSSAIDAMNYIKAPEYKNDLTTLFTVAAQTDKDQSVREAAQKALDELNKMDGAAA